MKKISFLFLAVLIASCNCSSCGGEKEDFGPYPTGSKEEQDFGPYPGGKKTANPKE